MPLPGSLVWRRGIKVITSPANNENESERLPSVCRRPCSRWRTPDRWWDPTDRSAVGSDEVRSGVRSSSWCCFAARILETGQQQYSHILSTQSLEGIETACHPLAKNSIVNYRKNTIVLSLKYTIVKITIVYYSKLQWKYYSIFSIVYYSNVTIVTLL